MLDLLEPKRTNYDVHFHVARIPVRVHPLFWGIMFLMGIGENVPPVYTFLWVLSAFVSILIHELGHAFTMLYFGYRPWVTLYGMGGLASYDRNESYGYDPVAVFGENYTRHRETRREVLISFAGPAAGFLFAALILFGLRAAGYEVDVSLNPRTLFAWNISGIQNPTVLIFISQLLLLNIYWGLINLLPIFPLDGGQISRELFMAKLGPAGMKPCFQLGMITAIIMAGYAVFAWPRGSNIFGLVMFGLLAYQNYTLLQAYGQYGGETLESGGRRRGGGGRPRQPWESSDDEDDERGW